MPVGCSGSTMITFYFLAMCKGKINRAFLSWIVPHCKLRQHFPVIKFLRDSDRASVPSLTCRVIVSKPEATFFLPLHPGSLALLSANGNIRSLQHSRQDQHLEQYFIKGVYAGPI